MSGYIPKDFIAHLLQRTDIITVINERVALTQRGNNYVACCPFHSEHTPSFTVSVNKQIYHCFGCGLSGNAIGFLMEFDRLNFVEAVELLAKSLGLTIPHDGNRKSIASVENDFVQAYKILQRVGEFYQKQLSISKKAQDYIKTRGLDLNTIQRFSIGYAPDAWHSIESLVKGNPTITQILIKTGILISKDNANPYDRFRDRLMFPIRDRRGRILGFGGRILDNSKDEPKYLNSPETIIFHKGKEVYGLFEGQQAIRQQQRIIIVEGYMDVVALGQFDINYAVATLGTAITKDHLQLLLRHAKQLTFCFDGDEAGRKAAWRALEHALSLIHEGIDVGFVFLPQGEDPDSLVRKQGKTFFLEKITQAMPLSEFFLKHLTNGINIAIPDGKTRFVQMAKPLLQTISDEVFKELMLQKMSILLRLDINKLEQLLGLQKNSVKLPSSSVSFGVPSAMRTLIALLLQHPSLYCELPEFQWETITIRGNDLFKELVEICRLRPNISTGALLAYFQDHKYYDFIIKLAHWELYIPEAGLINEFKDAFRHIQRQSLDERIENLLTKANLGGLSQEERRELQQLITEKHRRDTA